MLQPVPRLWTDHIDAHHRKVRDAILATTWSLVAEHGLLSVTMARVAEETGIGRATLYKHFPNIEAILLAWHHRHVTDHLARLAQLAEQAATPRDRLAAVLEAYADVCQARHRHGPDLGALFHRAEQVTQAEQQLRRLFREVLSEAAASGDVRSDVPVDELVDYCLHALSAAGTLPTKPAVRRLVQVTVAGLRSAQ